MLPLFFLSHAVMGITEYHINNIHQVSPHPAPRTLSSWEFYMEIIIMWRSKSVLRCIRQITRVGAKPGRNFDKVGVMSGI